MNNEQNISITTMQVPPIDTNCYLLVDKATMDAAIIDPGGAADQIFKHAQDQGANIKYIINTHGHWDHVGGNKQMQELTGAPILIHRMDADMLQDAQKSVSYAFGAGGDGGVADRLLEDGDIIELGSLQIKVIHTPGHTRGGISLLVDGALFCGDTLFQLSMGRTDFPGGNERVLIDSLKKLVALDDDIVVLPGHGPSTNIAFERNYNPFLRR